MKSKLKITINGNTYEIESAYESSVLTMTDAVKVIVDQEIKMQNEIFKNR